MKKLNKNFALFILSSILLITNCNKADLNKKTNTTNYQKTTTQQVLAAPTREWGFGVALTWIWEDMDCEFCPFWLCKSRKIIAPYDDSKDKNSTLFYIANNKLVIDVYLSNFDKDEVVNKLVNNKLHLHNNYNIPTLELPVEVVQTFNLNYNSLLPGYYDVDYSVPNRIKIFVN